MAMAAAAFIAAVFMAVDTTAAETPAAAATPSTTQGIFEQDTEPRIDDLGSSSATSWIVLFGDKHCSFCKWLTPKWLQIQNLAKKH
ncbi:hypothetical protein BJ742DRAFT_769243 [Cladochytrium replicatum]|nr:hypothetical protein BJ742DRAFT_769243 [Cladochytrium replicatum]